MTPLLDTQNLGKVIVDLLCKLVVFNMNCKLELPINLSNNNNVQSTIQTN